jgi:hypothetical protein
MTILSPGLIPDILAAPLLRADASDWSGQESGGEQVLADFRTTDPDDDNCHDNGEDNKHGEDATEKAPNERAEMVAGRFEKLIPEAVGS